MTDKIRSILNSELTMLPYKFADLEQATQQKNQLESRHKVEARHLFDKQWKLDKMRGANDKADKFTRKANDFGALCSLYFSQFLKQEGFDFAALEKELSEKKSVMERHLGKAWVMHLEFLVKLSKELKVKVQDGPRGLLKRAV